MKRTRLTALAASVLAIAALLVTASAGPADAKATCSARAALPARIGIDRDDVVLPVKIVTSCRNYFVSAYLNGPGGNLAFLTYDDSQTSSTIDYSTYIDEPGVYKTVLQSGSSDNFASGVSWISTSVIIRNATFDYIASSRNGRAVYINGLVKNYSSDGLIGATGRPVYLQRYINGAWQTMLSRTGDATGRVTVGFLQSTVFQYRWVSTDNNSQWGNHSISTFR